MARKLKSDRVLFTSTLLLVLSSIVMVYSASAVLAFERFNQPYLFVTRQLMWTVLGLGVMAFAMRVDYRSYRNERVVWGLLGLVGLMLAAVLFSHPVNGTRRWFGIGGLGIQPSELAKIACVLFTAMMLERRRDRINELSYSLPPLVLVTGAMVGLILLQPDFGTSMTLVAIVGLMVFSAGLHYRYLLIGLVLLVPLLTAIMIMEPYRMERLMVFLNPDRDPQGAGFQATQSLIAVGTGGVFGRGLMAGVQKLFYLPEPHTDFIYAVISEELGLVGATAVLICFAVIAWRGMRIAARAEEPFGALVALGLTTMIGVQAFVNMSVVLSLLPTKGIPLPLVSFGGSSMLVSLVGVGILLNISQHEVSGT